MNTKKLLCLLITLATSCLQINAQITSLPSSSAFMSTKYSSSNVNESSGRISTSIPIFNFKAGKIQIPISLSYTGNGVKVAQQSNWVGTNWNLNAGGVVTRVVYGYPDEKASQRMFLEDLGPVSTVDIGALFQGSGDTRDYGADIFSFAFAGYSGSFYLDKNFVPRLTDNNAELKIEFVGGLSATNANTILITTPNGLRYYFGGNLASESSSTLVKRATGLNTPIGALIPIAPQATTAYYLFKVENNYNDQVLFDYYDDGTKNFILFEQDTRGLVPIDIYNCQGPDCLSPGCKALLETYKTMKKWLFQGSIHNSKKIKRIYTLNSDLEVKFNSEQLVLPSDNLGANSPEYDDRILKSIQVFNKLTNQNIKNISLDYLQPSANNTLKYRFFLHKVRFNSSNNILSPNCEVYEMQYNGPEALPSRFSYATDVVGYYNGFDNQDFIDMQFYENINAAGYTRSDVEFELSKYGVLTKIIYPGGGQTEFEYERPYGMVETEKVVNLSAHKILVQETIPHVSPAIWDTKAGETFYIGQEAPTVPSPFQVEDAIYEAPITVNAPPVIINEDTFLKVELIKGDSYLHNDSTGSGMISLTVFDLTLNTEESVNGSFGFPGSSSNLNFIFNLKKDHRYAINFGVNHPEEHPFEASAYLRFYCKDYLPVGGIRIKKVTDISANQIVESKRYYYKKAKDIGKNVDDSSVLIFEPKLQTEVFENNVCSSLNVGLPIAMQTTTLTSNPFANIFGAAGNQIEYKYVTVSYGGDAFEKGGVEKHFTLDKQDDASFFASQFPIYGAFDADKFNYCNTNNKNLFNGTLLKELVLERKNNKLFVKSEKEYTYDLTVDHKIDNFALSSAFHGNNPAVLPIFNIEIAKYTTFSYRHNLKTIISKSFTEPLNINYPSAFANFVGNTTNFEYNLLRGLPSSIKTKDSKGKTLTTKLFYPVTSNINLLSALQPADINNYNILQTQNNIGSPIQVESYITDNAGVEKLLMTKRSLFTNNLGKILPSTEQVAKSNSTLFSNTFYTSYDASYNVQEVTQENQFKKSTIYGYKNSAVIAELTMPFANIPAATITSLKALSDNVIDQASMIALETQLNTLRTSFPEAQITTYVYNAVGQLDSVTDPRGRKMTSVYDECNRVKMTKDNEGNIIEEFKYNLINN